MIDPEVLPAAESILDAVDRADAVPVSPADLPAQQAELQSLCQALWQLIYEREQAGAAAEALDRPLLAMSRLAVLAWPDDPTTAAAYIRPLRDRPDRDPTKAAFLTFEARVAAARAEAARARQAYLDRYVSPGSFSVELLGDASPKILAYRTDAIWGPATLAVHLARPGRVDYLAYSVPLENGTHVGPYLEIIGPDPKTGPRAHFDVDGLWGYYEDGQEYYYAHGHEEGDPHVFGYVWGEWVLRTVAKILKRAGYSAAPPLA